MFFSVVVLFICLFYLFFPVPGGQSALTFLPFFGLLHI